VSVCSLLGSMEFAEEVLFFATSWSSSGADSGLPLSGLTCLVIATCYLRNLRLDSMVATPLGCRGDSDRRRRRGPEAPISCEQSCSPGPRPRHSRGGSRAADRARLSVSSG